MRILMMTRKVIIWISSVSIVLVTVLSGQSFAQLLTILTCEEPPLNFTDDQGALKGISIDLVHAIQKRVKNTDPIDIYPWARVHHMAMTMPNLVVFTVGRTREREEKFHWITIVNRNAWMLFAKKGSGLRITSLDDAKKVDAIGVVRRDIREQYLLGLGFNNLEPVTSWEQNIRKLLLGRISLVFYAASGAVQTCRRAGVDFGDLEILYTLKVAEAYITMSKGTTIPVVEKWRQAAKQIKRDGTFDGIARKWKRILKTNDGLDTHIYDGALNLWPAQ